MEQEPTAATDVIRPPGPSGYPVVGNLVEFVRDQYAFTERCAREYGDIAYYEVLGRSFYQVNSPEGIEHVLVHNNENYVKGELFQESLGPVLGNGLLNSEGEFWRRQRHLIGPAFEPDRIAEYAETMVERTEETAAQWRDGAVRDVNEDMMELTLEIVADALFGVDVGRDVDTVASSLEVVMDYQEGLSADMLPVDVPTPGKRRLDRAIADLERVVYRIVDERSRNPGDDVVSRMLSVEDETGRGMSREQIRDEVMTLLLAGHETTALALTFTTFLLAQHPRVERRLLDELDEQLGGDPSGFEDVRNLPYLEKVVEESMRLYPPVPGIIREATDRDEIAGYTIPEGATISINQWTVHRDPEYYDDPMAFRPERWTAEMEAELPPLAYFPFSAGPRRCVGDRFAMLEAKVVLATLLQRYHLELVSDPSLDLVATITARPRDPVMMRIHERD
ncbi:cytochrome P450 [Halosimplex salinum]|uniref:cytochrome P450 n=1 Tax=Halosimplex salinum TaxID=1710538 RepID=UPI000F469FFE|nr:cytochrome P450 [Halosimplex salinum]